MVRSTLFRRFFRQNPGSKHAKSQICTIALEFYISNVAESESVNDFLIHQRLRVAKIKMLEEKSKFLTQFVDFLKESEQTAARRFVIRNHRIRIYILAFHLFPDPLCIHVTGGGAQQFWWYFGKLQNHEKGESRANSEGLGASKDSLDLPSRAACVWGGGWGF